MLIVGLAAPIDMTWRIVALVIAAIALVTAAVRFCPANAILGINTCESEGKKGKWLQELCYRNSLHILSINNYGEQS